VTKLANWYDNFVKGEMRKKLGLGAGKGPK